MGVTDEMLSKDIHCLFRLKEGFAVSSTYKDIAIKLMVESNLTWVSAIRSLTVIDISITLRNLIPETNAINTVSRDTVKAVKPQK